MTDREIDPSRLPDTPLPSRDNTIANASAHEPRGPAVPASARAGGAGAPAGSPRAGGGHPRMRVTIYRPGQGLRDDIPGAGGDALGTGGGDAPDAGGGAPGASDSGPGTGGAAPDEAQSTGEAGESGGKPSHDWRADDRETTAPRSPTNIDIGPLDRIVEHVFPVKTLTDWMLADPLNRGELFKRAIEKDPAGVDVAVTRARAVGYTASRFTDALSALIDEGPAAPASGIRQQDSAASRNLVASDAAPDAVAGQRYAKMQVLQQAIQYGTALIGGALASRAAREAIHSSSSKDRDPPRRNSLPADTAGTPPGGPDDLDFEVDSEDVTAPGASEPVIRIRIRSQELATKLEQAGYQRSVPATNIVQYSKGQVRYVIRPSDSAGTKIDLFLGIKRVKSYIPRS